MKKGYKTVSVEVAGQIATMTLNRPEVINAFNIQMVKDYADCLEDMVKREDVRVIVCKGSGRGFSAGVDVKDLYDSLTSGGTVTQWLMEWQRAMRLTRTVPKIVIFEMSGYSLGAGFELALCGDFVIVSDDAKVGTPQINVGVPVELDGALIAQYCGMLRAKKLAFTGDLIDGKEAARIGLVTESVPPKRLSARVKELAKQMAEKDPFVVAAQKENIHMWSTQPLEYSIDHSILVSTKLLTRPGALKRIEAFMKKK